MARAAAAATFFHEKTAYSKMFSPIRRSHCRYDGLCIREAEGRGENEEPLLRKGHAILTIFYFHMYFSENDSQILKIRAGTISCIWTSLKHKNDLERCACIEYCMSCNTITDS